MAARSQSWQTGFPLAKDMLTFSRLIHHSAVDLTFASVLLRVLEANVKSETPLESYIGQRTLAEKFVS